MSQDRRQGQGRCRKAECLHRRLGQKPAQLMYGSSTHNITSQKRPSKTHPHGTRPQLEGKEKVRIGATMSRASLHNATRP